MNGLKIHEKTVTLVDHVESKLFQYIKEQKFELGDAIPNENELAVALGVSRSVLREALSRLRMLGLIQSRTRRGMVLSEPDMFGGLQRVMDPEILGNSHIFNLLGFRVAMEVGISNSVIENVTDRDIEELEEIVDRGGEYDLNFYKAETEIEFHSKLYEITGNKSIIQFQQIIYPVCMFIRDKFIDFFKPINKKLEKDGKLVTHRHLLEMIKKRDKDSYRFGMEEHLQMYNSFLSNINR